MRRYGFVLTAVAGIALLAVLVPYFDAAQPRGLSVTRKQARRAADVEARHLGVDLDRAYAVMVWDDSALLEDELARDPVRRRRADRDPVVSAILGGYFVTYFRPGLEKRPDIAETLNASFDRMLARYRQVQAEMPELAPKPKKRDFRRRKGGQKPRSK